MTDNLNDPLAIWRAYCDKKMELEDAQDRIAELEEELSIWKSVFPDIAPERVLPDRAELEKHLLKVEMENEMLRCKLALAELHREEKHLNLE